jgi:adenylosuccinate lyase
VILSTYHYIASGLVVNEEVIASHVARELPFMATENILMQAVKSGGDRQELHELIRQASQAAARKVKSGGENDLLARLAIMPAFARVARKFDTLTDPAAFTGRSAKQVDSFLARRVRPSFKKCKPLPPSEGPSV